MDDDLHRHHQARLTRRPAAVSVDWVERIDGDQPWERVSPRPPHTWADLAADIATIPAGLGGACRILVGGHMREAMPKFVADDEPQLVVIHQFVHGGSDDDEGGVHADAERIDFWGLVDEQIWAIGDVEHVDALIQQCLEVAELPVWTRK